MLTQWRDSKVSWAKDIREYFETGCECVLLGRISLKSKEVEDKVAANYYEINCTCTRNYKHLEE